MNNVASEKEVLEFLKEMRSLVLSKRFAFVPREKNRIGRIALNLIDSKDAINVILNLTVGDYHEGPSPDESGEEGDVWVFGADLEEKTAYIKLKITDEPWVKCLSFHPPERPLACPYRQEIRES